MPSKSEPSPTLPNPTTWRMWDYIVNRGLGAVLRREDKITTTLSPVNSLDLVIGQVPRVIH